MASSDVRRYQNTFWLYEDIVFVIFSHLDDAEGEENLHAYQRLMFRMALTCRSFAKPALQKLWETMDILMPFFNLLPTFTWVVGGCYGLREPVTGEQWDDFDQRARRVRSFHLNSRSMENIGMNVYSLVAQQHQGPIFPALRSFCYTLDLHREDSNTVSDPRIPLIYSPSLESLSWFIGFPSLANPTAFNTIIADTHNKLRNDGGNLKEVILSGDKLSSTTLTSILQFSQLQVLNLDYFPGEHITTAIVADIGCLPNLLNLAINFDESLFTTLKQPIGFPRLEALNVTGPGSLILQILEGMQSSHAKELECCFTDVDDCPEILQFISRWPKTLQVLSLVFDFAEEVPEPDFSLFLGVAKSLTKLVYPWEVDDDQVRQIALAWPSLEELDVRGHKDGQSNRLATLTSLETLAELCPYLLTLYISVVPQHVRPRLPSDPRFNHPLKKLSFGFESGPIFSAGASSLITHALRLFPMLDTIAFEHSDNYSYWVRGIVMTQQLHMFREEYRNTMATLARKQLMNNNTR